MQNLIIPYNQNINTRVITVRKECEWASDSFDHFQPRYTQTTISYNAIELIKPIDRRTQY